MPKSTSYTVKNAQGEVVKEGISKKAKAVELAQEQRDATRQTHTVETSAGNVVEEIKGVRPMKRTPQYSRTVELPEGFSMPEGLRAAYTRGRKNLVIAHDPNAGEDEGAYSVINYQTGVVLADGLLTTRESGAFCKTVELPEKVEPVVETANA